MKRRLGRFEEAQVVTNEHYPFNVVIALRLEDGPSPETLVEVLERLRLLHPLLRARVEKEPGNRYYFVCDDRVPAIPLDIMGREDSGHWRRVAEEQLNCAIDLFTGPPLRVTYLRGSWKDPRGEIIITFQHAVMDGPSGDRFLHRLLTLCGEGEADGAAEGGEPGIENPLPPPPADKFFPSSHRGPLGWGRNLAFLVRQVTDEIRYRRRIRDCRRAPIHPAGRCKILSFKLPPDTTTALTRHCREGRITLNSLFSAVLLISLHRHLYDGAALPLRHFSAADLRPYLKPPPGPDGLGSYFSLMRFTVDMDKDQELWDLASRINRLTYRAYKRGEKFSTHRYSALMMRTLLRARDFRMGTGAVSFSGPLRLSDTYGKTRLQGVNAFVSNFVLGPEYTAQVRTFGGSFYWDILYLDSDMEQRRAVEIAEEIRELLESAAGKCQ